jgi:hypothetical protein
VFFSYRTKFEGKLPKDGARVAKLCAVVLVVGSAVSINAHAAAGGCSVLGAFSPQARALCNAAKTGASAPGQAPVATVEGGSPAPRGVNGPARNDSDVAAEAPLVPPTQGTHRYELAKAGLSVDIAGDYPSGYAPIWKFASPTPQQISLARYNVLTGRPQGEQSFFVRIVEEQGRAMFEFAQRGASPCLAEIIGLPQVLVETPKRFNLANFHVAGDPTRQCQRRATATAPWAGWIALSAAANGDLKLAMQLDQAQPNGKPWFEFTGHDLDAPNEMSPQMAAADVQKKQEVAAAAAAREREVVAARAAEEARIKALPLAGPKLTQQVEAVVAEDSRGWATNKLQAGSVGDVRINSGTVTSGSYSLRATYAYAGGAKGWVVTQYDAGKFSCMQYWDSQGCRPVRKPGEGQAVMSAIVKGMMSDGGGSSSSRSCPMRPSFRNNEGQMIFQPSC